VIVKCRIVWFITLFFSLLCQADDGYRIGEGWQPTPLPIYLGGYLSIWSNLQENRQTIEVDELALMLYGEFDRWGFMSELEMDEPYTKSFGQVSEETIHSHLHIERLNITYYMSDYSEIMVGKFFSEVGFWNPSAINVLRDTTSDPHFIEMIFPEMTTGVLYKVFGEQYTFYMTLQHNRGIDAVYNNFIVERHYAMALSLEDDLDEWRIGGGWFVEENHNQSRYITLGYRSNQPSWTWMVESAIRKTGHIDKLLYDIYGQGVWHILPHRDLVVRLEHYQDDQEKSQVSDEQSAILGYTYRPFPYMALKGEVALYAHQASRWLFSFSMMF
jgi:hypothetical protein